MTAEELLDTMKEFQAELETDLESLLKELFESVDMYVNDYLRDLPQMDAMNSPLKELFKPFYSEKEAVGYSISYLDKAIRNEFAVDVALNDVKIMLEHIADRSDFYYTLHDKVFEPITLEDIKQLVKDIIDVLQGTLVSSTKEKENE